jgi:hypothetical protein
MSTPILPFAVWQSGTNENSIPANDNSLRHEILNGYVIADDVTAQPGSPVDGNIYIIPAGATGAQWSTFDPDDLAIYYGGTWYAYAPVLGVVVNLAGGLVAWTGSGGYVSVGGGGGGGSPGGPTNAVQYNTGSAFGGEAAFAYDAATNTLTVDNATLAGLLLTAGSATGGAGLRLPHGAAPTSPTNGDMWTTTAGLYVRINGTTVGPLSTGGGSLTNWTEAVNSSSPNTTVPVVSFTATNAATNVDAALIPKGTGSILRQIPDGTTTAGNKRGLRSVDFQATRSAATAVVAADDAFGAGANNTIAATAQYSAVFGSGNNIQSGSTNAFAAGSGHTIGPNSNYAAAFGNGHTVTGRYNLAAGNQNTVAEGCFAWGQQSQVGANFGHAGGFQVTTRSIYGMRAHGSGMFSAIGDAQERQAVLRAATTNNTATRLTSDQTSPGTDDQFVLPNSSAYLVRMDVVARENATGDCKTWEARATIKRGANAAATSLVGSAVVTVADADAGAAAWALALTADTTNGALAVNATGETSKNIKWTARVRSIEVVG